MSLAKQLEQFKQDIESWEGKIGLKENRLDPDEMDTLLNMSRANLETRGAELLFNDAIVLSQFAFVLQHKENQCQAFQRWARANRGRFSQAESRQVDDLVSQAEIKATRIAYLARRLEFVAQCINNAARARSTK